MAILLAGSCVLSAGCYNRTFQQSTDSVNAQQQEQQHREADAEVPPPTMHFWNEKRMATYIQVMRDQPNLSTWTYTKNMDGTYTWVCESLSYGLPYNTRTNNPMHYEYATTLTGQTSNSGNKGSSSYCVGDNGYWDYTNNRCVWGEHALMPQAEPNDLFIPDSAKGTWNICRDPETGKPTVSYQEEDISVFAYKLPAAMVKGFHPAPLSPPTDKQLAEMVKIILQQQAMHQAQKKQ